MKCSSSIAGNSNECRAASDTKRHVLANKVPMGSRFGPLNAHTRYPITLALRHILQEVSASNVHITNAFWMKKISLIAVYNIFLFN